MDWALAFAAAAIGVVVGLTGMGGGALMTPTLVLFFNIPPLTAVSSDLVTSAVMKPAGSFVHIRRGTVDWKLVRWLTIGSVPAAFAGSLVITAVGSLTGVQLFVKSALGIVLLMAAALIFVRAYIGMRNRARERRDGTNTKRAGTAPVAVRVLPTLLVGVVGGLMVGLTSVGSGSMIIVALMLLYPRLAMNRLVGTDLVQAVPLVLAAALGHLFFGAVDWSVAIPLIVGSVPGAWVGAQFSSRIPGGYVRRALAVVLMMSGLKLLNVDNLIVVVAAVAAVLAGTLGWMVLRKTHGLAVTVRQERRTLTDSRGYRADAPE